MPRFWGRGTTIYENRIRWTPNSIFVLKEFLNFTKIEKGEDTDVLGQRV
jgi:hypothetical protein